jgi:hypothetical protein
MPHASGEGHYYFEASDASAFGADVLMVNEPPAFSMAAFADSLAWSR